MGIIVRLIDKLSSNFLHMKVEQEVGYRPRSILFARHGHTSGNRRQKLLIDSGFVPGGTMLDIFEELAQRHGLSNDEVVMVLESFLSEAFTKRHRWEIMVVVDRHLHVEAVAYEMEGGIMRQRRFDLSRFTSDKALEKRLSAYLERIALVKQSSRHKAFERTLIWGEIVSKGSDQSLRVETKIFPETPIIAVCPLNRVGVHERNGSHLAPGSTRAFHLRRVEPVVFGTVPRLKITLDRVSKTLVENLLKSWLQDNGIKAVVRCLKRYVGHKSVVQADRRLPKEAVLFVDREVKERICVVIIRG